MKPPTEYDHIAWLADRADEYTAKNGLDRLSDFLQWIKGNTLAWVEASDFHLAADANLSYSEDD